jgi:hypothetical protein
MDTSGVIWRRKYAIWQRKRTRHKVDSPIFGMSFTDENDGMSAAAFVKLHGIEEEAIRLLRRAVAGLEKLRQNRGKPMTCRPN